MRVRVRNRVRVRIRDRVSVLDRVRVSHISPSRRREKVLDCESIQMRSEMCRSESMGTW